MKVTCMITGAVLGAATGAAVGAMMSPKRKKLRCTSLKAAKAVAALVDSVISAIGL